MGLDNFFNPKTIAIIGASNHEGKVGGIITKRALDSKSKIVPVNLSHDEIFGIKCCRSILGYEGNIDLAVIVIPKDFVAGALEECGKKGVKEVIIISAGFSESGNILEEDNIRKIAKKYGIRFIGPNCFGTCNPAMNLDLTFSATTPDKGDIAFISQSGALWSFIADEFKKIGFSGFVGLGNMGDLGFSDFIDYFSQDKKTKSIILYMERLKDGRKFIESCKKCTKPIYAVKAGKTEAGSKATFSHTGSLATDYDIYSGAFKQAGIIICSSPEEAFHRASNKKFILGKTMKFKIDKEVKIITNAGGPGALASDYLSEKGIKVLESKDILGAALSNDYSEEMKRTRENSIIVILTSQSMSDIEKTAEAVCDFKKSSKKNIIALFLGGEIMKAANKIFETGGVSYFNNFESFRNSI